MKRIEISPETHKQLKKIAKEHNTSIYYTTEKIFRIGHKIFMKHNNSYTLIRKEFIRTKGIVVSQEIHKFLENKAIENETTIRNIAETIIQIGLEQKP